MNELSFGDGSGEVYCLEIIEAAILRQPILYFHRFSSFSDNHKGLNNVIIVFVG
jgi:hypothetical protein